MRFKPLALAATATMTLAGAAAHAEPVMQSCAPMEIMHSSEKGLSYTLSCEAGSWRMAYTGSVPSGTQSTTANYQLTITGPDGAQVVKRRSLQLPTPSMLGQGLQREAVALDDGGLALRDCKGFDCTQYRPLGRSLLPKAAVTVTPEVKKLTTESARLAEELETAKMALAGSQEAVMALQKELATSEEHRARLEGETHQLANEQAATRVQLVHAEKALSDVQEQGKALQAELSVAATEKAQWQDKAGRFEQEVLALTTKLEAVSLARGLSAQTAEALKADLDTLRLSFDALTQEYDALAKSTQTMAAQQQAQCEASAAASFNEKLQAAEMRITDLMQENVVTAGKCSSLRGSFEFALQDVVAQHQQQIATLKKALPDVDFTGLDLELKVPTVDSQL